MSSLMPMTPHPLTPPPIWSAATWRRFWNAMRVRLPKAPPSRRSPNSACAVRTPVALIVAAALQLTTASLHAQVDVSYERIRNAASEPGNWLTHAGNYSGQRYSTLDQLTPANIGRLKPAWVYQSRDAGKWECTPLVMDGVLYVTERPNLVSAIDGKTGRAIWSYRRPLPTDVAGCCGPVNRGLAVLGDALYLCTFDCHLVCRLLLEKKKKELIRLGVPFKSPAGLGLLQVGSRHARHAR